MPRTRSSGKPNKPSSSLSSPRSVNSVVKPGVSPARKLRLKSQQAKAPGSASSGSAGSSGSAASASTSSKNGTRNGILAGAGVCLLGLLLVPFGARDNTLQQQQQGPPAQRPIPGVPSSSFATPSLDPTSRSAAPPSAADLEAVALEYQLNPAEVTELNSDDQSGSAADAEAEAEAEAAEAEKDMTPAERRAARKARRKKNKGDLRQAGFAGAGSASADSTGSNAGSLPGAGEEASGAALAAQDPRFRQETKEVDLARQHALYSGLWNPSEVCSALDVECPAVHRKLHAQLPDSSLLFECGSSRECSGYPCVDGQCVCAGTATAVDCGSQRLLHFEWANSKASKTPSEQSSGMPSLKTFTKLLRGATPVEALLDVISQFSLVQDPQQSELDAKVEQKLKPELEFLLRATLETSPDASVDLTPLVVAAMKTAMQAQIWMAKNLIRYVPIPRALRLGVQAHGEDWFFHPLAEVLRWSSHPAAKPIDFGASAPPAALQAVSSSSANDSASPSNPNDSMAEFPGHSPLSLATHWQLYGAMQLLLSHGGQTPGALQHAIKNHDAMALKILLGEGASGNGASAADPADPMEKDAFGRSPLELAELAQEFAFDNVLGHLHSVLNPEGSGGIGSSQVAKPSSSASSSAKKRHRTKKAKDAEPEKEPAAGHGGSNNNSKKYGGKGGRFFERAGTDVQINCGVDVVAAAELTSEVFLRDYVAAGRPLFIQGGIDDWDLAQMNLQTVPEPLLDAEVAANQIPYGDQLGVESHPMKLRDYFGYMRTLGPQVDELPLTVYDTNILESNVMSDGAYQPGSHGTEGGNKFYHSARYPWSKEGAVLDAMNALSTSETQRWSHFFIGPEDGGNGLQTRCSTFTSLTEGKQLWMAFPPSQPGYGSAYSSQHPIEWLREVNMQAPEVLQGGGPPMSSPIVCEVEPGYTLYTPSMWTSSTINLAPTMGVTMEVVDNCIL